jgi:hypothetical protein
MCLAPNLQDRRQTPGFDWQRKQACRRWDLVQIAFNRRIPDETGEPTYSGRSREGLADRIRWLRRTVEFVNGR